MLTYLPADGACPYAEEALVAAARLVRDLHAALESFVAPPDAVWAVARPAGPGYRVGHNDIGPANTLYAGGLPYGFIDWELAGPAPPLHDLALAASTSRPSVPTGSAAWSASPSRPTAGHAYACSARPTEWTSPESIRQRAELARELLAGVAAFDIPGTHDPILAEQARPGSAGWYGSDHQGARTQEVRTPLPPLSAILWAT